MKIESNSLESYKDAPWPDEHIVHEDENIVVYKDGFPVTEGHLLFVPKKKERRSDITQCFEYAYDWGVRGILEYKWEGFNVGINQNEVAGQSGIWPHVHMIPRIKGLLSCIKLARYFRSLKVDLIDSFYYGPTIR